MYKVTKVVPLINMVDALACWAKLLDGHGTLNVPLSAADCNCNPIVEIHGSLRTTCIDIHSYVKFSGGVNERKYDPVTNDAVGAVGVIGVHTLGCGTTVILVTVCNWTRCFGAT
jgi:hypothetical protein